jgi:YggT family protein
MWLLQLNIIHGLVSYGISFIILAMLVRAIASWFGLDERIGIIRFLARITDPFIAPLRRFVPPIGIVDLSFLIAWFMLATLQMLLLQALPPAW